MHFWLLLQTPRKLNQCTMPRLLKIIYFLVYLVNSIKTLKYPPSFTRQPAAFALIQNQNSIVLDCEATGYPKPMYSWRKNGIPFNYQNNSRILPKLGTGSLEFLRPNLKDSGVYQCIVENQHGRAISNLALVKETTQNLSLITETYQAPFWIKTPNDTMDSKLRRISFECIASGNPKPSINWLKNGQPIRQTNRIQAKENQMTINPILGDIDTAVYQCNASNNVGFVLANFYLNTLQFMPSILKSPKRKITVMNRTDVELNCKADGSPFPSIKWEKDNYPISNGPKFIVNEGYLKVLNVSTKDIGEYRCFASNKLGTDYKSTHLFLLNSTKITTSPENTYVRLGSSVRFRCHALADSNLNLKIVWKFNGRRLDPSLDSRLTLDSVNNSLHLVGIFDSDFGQYTCIASTEYDSVNSTAVLALQTVPNEPKITKVTCNGILASIEWAPKGDNGAPILSYDIQLSNNFEPFTWSNVFTNISAGSVSLPTQRRIIPLKPWTRYSFRVLARNSIGFSKPSIPYGFCSTKSLPPFKHPDNVTVRADAPGSLTVTWNEMNQTEHNADGFCYKVYWKSADDPDDQWHCQKIFDWTQTETTLEELGIYKPYRIRVESQNRKGHPSQSAEEIIEWSGEAKPIKAPQNLQLLQTISSNSALVSWNPVPKNAIQGQFKGYKAIIKANNGMICREEFLKQKKHASF